MILRLDVNIGTLLPDCAFSCSFFPDKLKGGKNQCARNIRKYEKDIQSWI